MKAICVLKTGGNIAKVGYELGQFKSNMFHAARDMTIAVKRQPLKAIGVTFGVAFGIGTLAGWLVARR
jgi:hypothetical protein